MPNPGHLRPGARLGAAMCLFLATIEAADHRGRVHFGAVPVPGATVVLTQNGGRHSAVTDAQGAYTIVGVADAPFAVEIEMQLFAPLRREFQDTGSVAEWELELLPADQMARKAVRHAPAAGAAAFRRAAVTAAVDAPPPSPPAGAPPPDISESAPLAADGFLINGSVNNSASSPFSQLPAFGNNRRGQRSLYNGNLGLILNNSRFDARSFSLTGQNTPKPVYNRVQGLFSFGGPLRIPGLLSRSGPVFTINYQWTRNSNAVTRTGLVPTPAERAGVFAQPVRDPLTGAPFPGDRIPESRIAPQALALLGLYPEPDFTGNARYNYQVPVVSAVHQDDLQTRAHKQAGHNFYSGNFSWKSTRSGTPDLFGFLDTGHIRGINATAAWRRFFSPRAFLNLTVNFNRLATRTTPFFSRRENVSAEAGIAGNNQEPVNWGPPNLVFAQGTADLISEQASLVRNQTSGVSSDWFFSRANHNLTAGATLRRQQFNVLSQEDARGTFTFTGAAAGSDLAGFLLGVPDTASIAFGNADKYLRGRIYEAFVNDDWRLNPGLTINAGLRWEYWAPVSEKYGRLVNLDVAAGFTSTTPAAILPRPDRNNIAPRMAFAWRPAAAWSMVLRGGYGVYYDTSIYQPIAMEMAQQAPLSLSFRLANSPVTPLTLGAAFTALESAGAPTFAVDPGFRTGYAQIWQLALKRDLSAGLQFSATYSGNKGTRAQQRVLPNTYPRGAAAPAGFAWLASNGNSIRHAGQFQLRRRMRSGFTAQLQYTWAKSLDNAMLGGQGRPMIAQDWLDLRAERGRSAFDQRHLFTGSFQYTSGMGLHGGALARGWPAALLKGWTIGSQITLGSGLPLSPLYQAAVPGTGFTGILRPDYTGAPLYDAPAGLHLNPAAVRAPGPGAWGNAGRNSINGPRQFALNSYLGRTFRSSERISFDVRVDASNVTNTPTFPSWNAVLGSAQFGLPNSTNPMRSVRGTLRMRF